MDGTWATHASGRISLLIAHVLCPVRQLHLRRQRARPYDRRRHRDQSWDIPRDTYFCAIAAIRLLVTAAMLSVW